MANITVHVKLLNEGTEVWRPVMACLLPDGTYELTNEPDLSSGDEEWEFPPGSKVVCEERRFADGQALVVAVALAKQAIR